MFLLFVGGVGGVGGGPYGNGRVSIVGVRASAVEAGPCLGLFAGRVRRSLVDGGTFLLYLGRGVRSL